jgi:glycosyltransferase involved in cell wall biosynthesis
MVPYKGPDMLLQAAAPLIREGRLRLDMVGDGPMLPWLKTQAQTLEITQGITFHGWLEHGAVQDILCRCHLLAFPSIREFGGGVVLEAMALGVVPLVVDYAGPGELVSQGTGLKVPCGNRQQIVEGFEKRLRALADDPAALPAMAQAARQRVQDRFLWSRKASQVARLYEWVLSGGTGPAPAVF